MIIYPLVNGLEVIDAAIIGSNKDATRFAIEWIDPQSICNVMPLTTADDYPRHNELLSSGSKRSLTNQGCPFQSPLFRGPQASGMLLKLLIQPKMFHLVEPGPYGFGPLEEGQSPTATHQQI